MRLLKMVKRLRESHLGRGSHHRGRLRHRGMLQLTMKRVMGQMKTDLALGSRNRLKKVTVAVDTLIWRLRYSRNSTRANRR